MYVICLQHGDHSDHDLYFGPYKKFEEAWERLVADDPLEGILTEDNFVDCRIVYVNSKKLLKETKWPTSIWTRLRTLLSSVRPATSTAH